MNAYCEASLNFFAVDGPIPRIQKINNARLFPDGSLEEAGFQLLKHKSAVGDWTDLGEIEDIHYDEIEAIAKQVTGCDWVLFFPAIIRNPEQVKASSDFAPIQFAHSDYTEKYFETLLTPGQRYHRIAMGYAERAGFRDEDISLVKRVVTLQFWRNTGVSKPDYPLCFGDARTFNRERLLPIAVDEYGGLETKFESFAIAPPEDNEYHWYTYPELRPDEVVMFRAYDSDRVEAGSPFWTPHSAFADPTGTDLPPRQSIEMRAICLFR